ncbi:MAG TPA: hypothetical protein DCX17_01340, partial [Firmicutes bacterium]|nr:hypothetical protein [Bacillota bacterium]
MWLLQVLIEHASLQLDRPFTYWYEGELSFKKGFRVLVPFNHQSLVGYVLDAEELQEPLDKFQAKAPHKLLPIEQIIDQEPLLNEELMHLAFDIAAYNFLPRISMLQAMVPSSLKPQKSALGGPQIAYEAMVKVIDSSEDGLTLKQIEWLRIMAREAPFSKRDCRSPSILNNLISKKKVEIYFRERMRLTMPAIDHD